VRKRRLRQGSAKATASRLVSTGHRISHPWLNDHIPMDKPILRKWLAAGYMEEGVVYPTEAGTPQGGILTPLTQKVTSSLSGW
jgi:RNA-directed DNA polymerase